MRLDLRVVVGAGLVFFFFLLGGRMGAGYTTLPSPPGGSNNNHGIYLRRCRSCVVVLARNSHSWPFSAHLRQQLSPGEHLWRVQVEAETLPAHKPENIRQRFFGFSLFFFVFLFLSFILGIELFISFRWCLCPFVLLLCVHVA